MNPSKHIFCAKQHKCVPFILCLKCTYQAVCADHKNRDTIKYVPVQAEDFVAQLNKAVPDKYKGFITWYTLQEHKQMGTALYISNTCNSGFGINPDGEILSVFSKPRACEGAHAIQSALDKGGKFVLCFEGFLSNWYARFGFKVTKHIAWNDDYAPTNWDFQQWGRPNVLIMERKESNEKGNTNKV